MAPVITRRRYFAAVAKFDPFSYAVDAARSLLNGVPGPSIGAAGVWSYLRYWGDCAVEFHQGHERGGGVETTGARERLLRREGPADFPVRTTGQQASQSPAVPFA